MNNTAELKQIQRIDLDIMKQLVSVIENHGLKYFLIGGTLLGAVRHKGFIPWDDDVDIAMPRKDYEIFLKDYKNELPDKYQVENFKTNPSFKYNITRVYNTKYKVQELRNKNRGEAETFVSIDIFPIDGVPNNKVKRNMFYFKVLSLRALISLMNKENIDRARKRNVVEKSVILIGSSLPLKKMFSQNNLQFKIDQILRSQNPDSICAGTIMGAYRTKEIVPRKFFGNGKIVKFEGIEFVAPELTHEYLKHMYGDYMKLPSVEEQNIKRHFRIKENL